MTGTSQWVRPRQSYVDLCERYFAELDQKRSLDAVLDCFTDDAVLVCMPDCTAAGRAAITGRKIAGRPWDRNANGPF